jgi:ABC-type transport system substrate-binding protein
MSRKWLLVCMCASVLGLGAVIGPAAYADEIKRGGTLTVARLEEPQTFDPFIPSDNGSIYAIAQVCEPLISADATGTKLEPGLAESWEAAADGMAITFKIRQGIKFNDGTSMTIDDAVYSLQQVANPKASYGFAFEPVKSIEKLDDSHLKITLKTPYAALQSAQAIMKVVYFGYGEIPNGFTPKMNFWSDKVEKIPYDIEKAKALVKEAGYDGTPIQLIVDTGNAPFRQIATILQQGWEQAGLKVEIVEFDVGTAFGMTQKASIRPMSAISPATSMMMMSLLACKVTATAQPKPSSRGTRMRKPRK